jgi:hypothetical protein
MRFCLALSLLMFSSTLAFAQAAGGVAGISGVVRDSSGAVIPNAKVVVSNDAQGLVRNLTTNASGIFTAPALIPASGYKVTVNQSGFAPYEAGDLILQVGQNLNLEITLGVGQTATSVEVNAAAQLIEDSKTDVSQVVNTRQITELPINGRRVDSFVLLTPGVSNDATFGLLTFRGVAGNNSFLLDGNDNTEQFYDENAGRTRIRSQISQDAVQEFQVVSADFSAEYGRAMGGVVNTVTKSGTNSINGDIFYFLRSTGFDAKDPYSAFNPTEHRIQTGATIGGPIIKNKLFYFLSVDITRRNFPMVDSQIKVGVLDPVNQVWTPAACPRHRRSARRSMGCFPASTGRSRALPTTTSTSAVSITISMNGTLSAQASTTCAGYRRMAFKPACRRPPARPSPAMAMTLFSCVMASSPGPGYQPIRW